MENFSIEERQAYAPLLEKYVLTGFLGGQFMRNKRDSFQKKGKKYFFNKEIPGKELNDEVIEALFGNKDGDFDQSKTALFTTLEAATARESKKKSPLNTESSFDIELEDETEEDKQEGSEEANDSEADDSGETEMSENADDVKGDESKFKTTWGNP